MAREVDLIKPLTALTVSVYCHPKIYRTSNRGSRKLNWLQVEVDCKWTVCPELVTCGSLPAPLQLQHPTVLVVNKFASLSIRLYRFICERGSGEDLTVCLYLSPRPNVRGSTINTHECYIMSTSGTNSQLARYHTIRLFVHALYMKPSVGTFFLHNSGMLL
jgi:hypothetical protein